MPKFKVNDIIECVESGRGFDNAVVLGTFTEKKGIHKGKEMYLLKIMCGTATVPISSADVNYRKIKPK